MNRILFYRVNEPYGEFSNFAPYPIELKGKVWPTSEHYFQAQKFAGTDYEEAIRLAETPMIAANMGRNRERMLRLGWEGVKDDIMREALRARLSALAPGVDVLVVARPPSARASWVELNAALDSMCTSSMR